MFLKRFLSSATSDALKKRQQELMSRSLPKKKTLSGVHNVILVASGKGEISFYSIVYYSGDVLFKPPKGFGGF